MLSRCFLLSTVATKELQAIIQAHEQARQAGRSTALVTVFKTTGSTYRRPGARMLVLPTTNLIGADFIGSISGGCLEDDARERALETLSTGRGVSVCYDTTAEADILLGSGVGCQGVVHVIVQPLPFDDLSATPPGQFARVLRHRRRGVLATVCAAAGYADPAEPGSFLFLLEGDAAPVGPLDVFDPLLAEAVAADMGQVLATGSSRLQTYSLGSNGRAEVFFETISPPRSLLICGAGQDAIPLAHLGKELGWRVRVVDGRRAYATPERFPDVDELIVCPPREFASRLAVEPGEAVVLLTHNFLHDKEFLRAALASSAGYIGLLGPRRRKERLLAELAHLPDSTLGKRSLNRVYGPAGLDIGAEAPEQIALAIVAEIEAVFARRRGGILKRRRAPLHDAPRSGLPLVANL